MQKWQVRRLVVEPGELLMTIEVELHDGTKRKLSGFSGKVMITGAEASIDAGETPPRIIFSWDTPAYCILEGDSLQCSPAVASPPKEEGTKRREEVRQKRSEPWWYSPPSSIMKKVW